MVYSLLEPRVMLRLTLTLTVCTAVLTLTEVVCTVYPGGGGVHPCIWWEGGMVGMVVHPPSHHAQRPPPCA